MKPFEALKTLKKETNKEVVAFAAYELPDDFQQNI